MKYDTELTLILLTLALAVTFIPLLLGFLIAKATHLTGYGYYNGVLIVACIIWGILLLYYYK